MSEIENQFGRTLIVVAHPDDEVIGCGVLLQRLKRPSIAFLTDGAPTDRYFWGKYGSRTAYAEKRATETRAALARLKGAQVTYFGARDQQLIFHLDAALAWLREKVAEVTPKTIVTHAYEGGHPDHDCASFLCSVAGAERGIPVWEMPLYCRVKGKLARQYPLRKARQEVCIGATPTELRHKTEMVSAYESQQDFLRTFDAGTERFQLQQNDFSRPPHPGKLNYECWGWEISGSDLCNSFRRIKNLETLQRAKTA